MEGKSMINLDTNDVGFDSRKIGFPSLKTCMAIVYQMNTGLLGWHDAYANSKAFTSKCGQFQTFVQNKTINFWSAGENLFGLINREERFNDNGDGLQRWTSELTEVAEALKFKGPIWGVRIASHVARLNSITQKDAKMDSLYAEFEFDPGSKNKSRPVTVKYRTQSGMKVVAQQPEKPLDIYGHLNTNGNPYTGYKSDLGNVINVASDFKAFFLYTVGDRQFIKIR